MTPGGYEACISGGSKRRSIWRSFTITCGRENRLGLEVLGQAQLMVLKNPDPPCERQSRPLPASRELALVSGSCLNGKSVSCFATVCAWPTIDYQTGAAGESACGVRVL